jgi:ADP-heptose:LPS heptosyltransferase
MTVDKQWSAARRILIVRLDNLGDVLVTTPAIRAVRQALPLARITLLASPVGAQVGRLDPDIDEVMVYEAPWMDPWHRLPQDSGREQRAIAQIKDKGFDGAIIFTSFRQSPLPAAYLCYLAGIPLRLAASIDGPGSLLTTRHKHPQHPMHEVERGLDLVGAIGITAGDPHLVVQVPAEAREEARAVLARPGGQGPLVVLHPGCSMPARTYPWEMFAEAADILIEQVGATVVLTGVAEERPLVHDIVARMRHAPVDLAGQITFPVLCALIEAADLTVTNNTGPMHIAAALGTPVVALFALTNPPEQWGPWMVPHRQLFHDVPCRICYNRVCPYGHECLRLVSPETVASAAVELLAEEHSPAAAVVGTAP